MFIIIKENALYEWADHQFDADAVEVDIDYNTFDINKYQVIDGELVDISSTPEYIQEEADKEKQILIANLMKQIEAIDIKRIRAIAEPQLKDGEQTWLEYYTSQVVALRSEIASLL